MFRYLYHHNQLFHTNMDVVFRLKRFANHILAESLLHPIPLSGVPILVPPPPPPPTPPLSLESSSSLVMALYGKFSTLTVASPGDKAWRTVECLPKELNDDIIFFNGHFYVISYEGVLLLCEDLNTTQPKTTPIASPPDESDYTNQFYLVNLCGYLHLVERYVHTINGEDEDDIREFHDETKCFFVYKFDFLTKKWTETEDLGDNALFVGNNPSFAISTSEFPEFKGNCVYFTDEHTGSYKRHFCDIGVYDLKEDTIEHFYLSQDRFFRFSRPIFFMPCF